KDIKSWFIVDMKVFLCIFVRERKN
ncbi:hypothetical protein W771_02601, partial [Staphylococcus aureus VET1035S]